MTIKELIEDLKKYEENKEVEFNLTLHEDIECRDYNIISSIQEIKKHESNSDVILLVGYA